MIAAALFAVCLFWFLGRDRRGGGPPPATKDAAAQGDVQGGAGDGGGGLASTTVYAHNLLLRKGPQFRIYVRWVRGEMVRTLAARVPSFDAPDSFVLEIQKGLIRVNIGDLSTFLNSALPANSPLKNVSIKPNGEQIKLQGTVHKIISLPVELDGVLSPMPDGRVRYHVNKINVLKIPMKALLGGFHVKLADMASASEIQGVQIAENDVYFDTQKLLPPPHIRGKITAIRVAVPDLEVIYGTVPNDEGELAQWHNFLRLTGGMLTFGKLTMHPVDLTMIDASQDAWFDLDLVNYQSQLVNGYTRMTEKAGLELYMPGAGEKSPKRLSPAVTLDWLKDRTTAVPAGVPTK